MTMMPDSASELAARHCEDYRPGTPTMPHEEAQRLLQFLPGWSISGDGKMLLWTNRMADFATALAFVNKVGEIAESQDHHPDIRIHGYRNVDLELSTHSIGGLSQNDFIMAAKINQLAA